MVKSQPESWASSAATRKSMQGNRSKDTLPELRLRHYLFAQGLRYRVNTRPIKAVRRTADVVFGNGKVAVFVHGCFWHGCAEHFRSPATNNEFWQSKIKRNQVRDAETESALEAAGWLSLIVWEHDDVETAAALIAQVVRQRRS